VVGPISRSRHHHAALPYRPPLPTYEAVQLRVAEQYIGQFGQLAKESNTMVLPASVADVGSMIALAMNVIGRRPNGVAESPQG